MLIRVSFIIPKFPDVAVHFSQRSVGFHFASSAQELAATAV
jgi:hypothetical protein